MTALARVMGPALVGFAYDAWRTGGAIVSQVLVAAIVGIVLLSWLLEAPNGASESPTSKPPRHAE